MHAVGKGGGIAEQVGLSVEGMTCATCAVDSGQCVTAEELWSLYRATTS